MKFHKVAEDIKANAYAIRKEDAYASHVTEEEKNLNLERQLQRAEDVRKGNIASFATWQRVNEYLTGNVSPS